MQVLARHLTYKVGLASRQWPLRAYADAGLPALKVYMRKERSPVSFLIVAETLIALVNITAQTYNSKYSNSF